MEALLFDLVSAVTYCLVELLFCVIALIRLKKGKSYWEYYILGLALQSFALFGAFRSLNAMPVLLSNVITKAVLSVIVALVFLFVLISYKKNEKH